MAVDCDNLKSSIWNIFYNLIKTNVVSVSIKGSGGASTKTITIQNVSSSFPDKVFDAESNYPIIIISSPTNRMDPVTYTSREVSGTIEFEIFTNQGEAADKIADLITHVILDNESVLNGYGLEELELDSEDSNNYDRNKINVHSRMVVWRYKYSW
jgi:hypothetical protein